MMERTTVYFPDDLRRKIASLAERTGRSQAEIMREALRMYVERQARAPLTFIGLGDNPEVDAAEADFWLSDNWHPD